MYVCSDDETEADEEEEEPQPTKIKFLKGQIDFFFFSFEIFTFLAYWPIGHKLLAWPGVGGVVVRGSRQQFFQPLLRNYCTEYSKLYVQLPYIGVYKNSSFHVDPIVDVDFIGLDT